MDFWDNHGILFIVGLTLFPRLTVLLFSSVTGGLLFWVGFLLFPRVFIVILAAASYWDTNPILVVLAFIFCLSGEGAEKVGGAKLSSRARAR